MQLMAKNIFGFGLFYVWVLKKLRRTTYGRMGIFKLGFRAKYTSIVHKKSSLNLVNFFGSREDRIRTCDPPAEKQDILPGLN